MDVKNEKVIAIRADASTRIGTGHVMRCLTLANKLKNSGCRIIFLCKQHQGHLNAFIESSGFEVIDLSSPIQNINLEKNDKLWLGCSDEDDAQECLSSFDALKVQSINLLIVS